MQRIPRPFQQTQPLTWNAPSLRLRWLRMRWELGQDPLQRAARLDSTALFHPTFRPANSCPSCVRCANSTPTSFLWRDAWWAALMPAGRRICLRSHQETQRRPIDSGSSSDTGTLSDTGPLSRAEYLFGECYLYVLQVLNVEWCTCPTTQPEVVSHVISAIGSG